MSVVKMYPDIGIVIVNIKGKLFKTIQRVQNAVTQVTGVKCGYDMKLTQSGEMMFHYLTKEQADRIRSMLENELDPASFESLAFRFDVANE